MTDKVRYINKCAWPSCLSSVFVVRRSREGYWFNFCKRHYELIEMVSG